MAFMPVKNLLFVNSMWVMSPILRNPVKNLRKNEFKCLPQEFNQQLE